jgi:hypothetical protein
MKKTTFILPIIALLFAVSCEDNLVTWIGEDRITFRTNAASDTLVLSSFVKEPDDVTRLTVLIEIQTEGMLRNYPRTMQLKQVSTGDNDAEAGTHFEPFDTPPVTMPAGAHKVLMPVVLLRHPSLQEAEKTLRIELVENENFLLTTKGENCHFRQIVFADRVMEPTMWEIDCGRIPRTLGRYGAAKHRFMIEALGRDVDNEYLETVFWFSTAPNSGGGWVPRDYAYTAFLQSFLEEKLEERNVREGNILREKPGQGESVGRVVSFRDAPTWSNWVMGCRPVQ